MGNVLHVVTDRAWMRDELASNTLLPVAGTFGYEIPKFAADDYWWIPQGMATRFRHSGVNLNLQAPGPFWMEGLQHRFIQRRLSVETLEDTRLAYPRNLPGIYTFHKFAEAKVDWYQAGQGDLAELLALCDAHDVPKEALLLASERLALGNEYRFFIEHGQVATGSVYLVRDADGEHTYYDLLDEPQRQPPLREFATALQFLNWSLPQISGPDGYVIDVGFTTAGEPVIIEANPAWCSAWYGCDIDAVVASIQAAHAHNPRWWWVPDAYLIDRYERMRPLPHA